MSQRSHIAHSGSSAISACSAACSEPSSFGICVEPSSCPRLGHEPDRLGLEARLRQLERDEVDRLLRPDRLALVATTCSVTETAPKLSSSPSRRSVRSGSTISVVVSFLTCVYQSPANGSTTRGARLEVELAHEVRLAEVEVDRALVDRRVRALALDQAEHGAGRAVDDRERVGARRAQRDARRGVVAAGPDEAGVGAAQLGEHRRPLERRVAEQLAVGVVERRLEGGGAHVAVEHARVLVVEDRRLDAAAEQRLAARA